jgi:hypothetical protein
MRTSNDTVPTKATDMGRRPGSAREIDLQTLKQASACVARAIELFVQLNDEDAAAQAQLAWRFLDEFVDKHSK